MNFTNLYIAVIFFYSLISLNAQECAIRNVLKNNIVRNNSLSIHSELNIFQNLGTTCSNLSNIWGNSQYSDDDDVIIYKNCIDKLGNSFICGNLRDGTLFNGGFVVKFDISGNNIWQLTGDSDYSAIYNIAADNQNNFVVIGDDNNDYSLIKKFNSNNTLVWKKEIANDNSSPLGVITDNQNNIYIVGYFTGSAWFDNFNISSSTDGDMYICKMDASGNVLWVKNVNVKAEGSKWRLELSIDQNNNLYLCSEFKGNISFLGTNISNKGNNDIFVAKVNFNGTLGWVNTFGSVSDDIGVSCSVDKNGNVFATGYSYASIDQNPFYGYTDVFIVKINNFGNRVWFKSIGGKDNDLGRSCIPDNQGGCLITGSFNDNLFIDNKLITNATDNDGFVINVESSGKVNWVEKITGTGTQGGSNLASINDSEFLLSGTFSTEYKFGSNTIFATGSSLNGFSQRVKLNNSPSPSIKQNIVGKWKGILNNGNGDFYFEMDLKYDEINNKVSGTTFISRNEDYALFEIEGYLVGECQVFFKEIKVLNQKTSVFNWCFKEGILTISSDISTIMLIGDWFTSGNCNPGTISVSKISPSIILSTSNDINFGSKQLNTNNTLLIDLKNTGNAVMIIDSIRFPEGYSGNWTKNTILPNSSKSLTVTFKPTLAKNYDGNITLYSNISQGSNLIPVKGVGIPSPVATISLSTSSLDFGEQEVKTIGNKAFEITNNGTIDLNISSITYPNGFNGDFYSGKIKPNEKKQVNVFFNPLSIISYTGNIVISSNASNGVLQYINCIGNGITPKISTLSIQKNNIDFGYANIGTTKQETIEISNIGNKDINISSIKLLNGYKLNVLPLKLLPNEKKSIIITFYPTDIKDYNGKIIFYSDATNGDSEISCIGKGIIYSPEVSCNPQIIKENETLKIVGKYFLPNTLLKLIVYNKLSTQILLTKAITSDANGDFNYTFQLSATERNGNYIVAVNEEINNGKSSSCWFQFLPSNPYITSNLDIIRPYDSEISETGELNIKFTDILTEDRYHPINQRTFERAYSYKILYRLYGNGNWIEIKNFAIAYGQLNKKIEVNYTFKNIPIGKYEFKIIDNFNSNNYKISSVFEVVNKKENKISVDFIWDKSYDGGINYAPIKGVAAEGVSRFYIDINPNLKAIKSIKCLLFDNLSTQEPQNLGKLMITSEQGNVTNLKYTDEANEAKSITKDIKDLTQSPFLGKLRLWYIAPDDFASNALHKDSSYRTVFLKLNFILEDKSYDSLFIPIKIVRPPLMLVHGWFSDPTTWESLRYVNKNNDTIYFKDDKKFINANRLIKIYPDKSFDDNSKLLLEDQSSSFNSVIGEMRAKGFVCNQVDYVCHSMGGAIIRNIYSKYYDSFYLNSESNKVNNYGKGYINKYITINTPHFGSPWGDFLSEYIPQWGENLYFDYLAYVATNYFEDTFKSIIVETEKGYEASKALKNLGTKEKFGGVHFTDNKTKAAHFLSSDIIMGLGSLPNLPSEAFVLNDNLKYLLEIENKIILNCIPFFPLDLKKKIKNKFLDNADPLNYFVGMFNVIAESYSKTDFCLNSDLVVSTESQTAGNLSSAVNIPKYVSHFEDNTTVSPSYSHITFKDKVLAGNRVFELLNSKVNSELFTQNISKTPSLISIDERDEKVNVINYLSDTSKIKIVTPSNNSIFKVGENIVVKVAIKDTVNSFRVVLNSQYYNYEKYQIEDTCIFVLPIKGNKLGEQKMVAEISYFMPNGLDIYADTIIFSVVTDSKITNFEVLPKYNLIKVGENINLNLKVYYQNFTTSWYDTSKMKITIESPDLLTFQHKNSKVKPLKEGSTFIAFDYENYKDTIYFLIEGKITNTKEIYSIENQVNIYPNPTTGILKITFDNIISDIIEISVFNQQGQLVCNSKEEYKCKNNTLEKDFSSLNQGLYIISIKGNKYLYSLKFVKI